MLVGRPLISRKDSTMNPRQIAAGLSEAQRQRTRSGTKFAAGHDDGFPTSSICDSITELIALHGGC